MTVARPFEILPAIDLRGGRVVRLRQGDFGRETTFSDDPAGVAAAFVEGGARWLHVVDLDGARTGASVHGRAIAAIVEAAGDRARIEVAGGLRTGAAIAEILALGAARAVVGTAALEDPGLARTLVEVYGDERVVVAIDVRGGRAIGHAWSADAVGVDAADAIRQLADAGVEIFEVTAIERDGLLGGPDLALYERLARLDCGTIIASGGIATVDDLRNIRAIGCTGAIVGRALYDRSLDLRAAVAFANGPL
jgi:phosphoribosylformimino-5-aminoimidazole carboxamide ribotide isomerase